MKNKRIPSTGDGVTVTNEKRANEHGLFSGRRLHTAQRILQLIKSLPKMNYFDKKVHAANMAVLVKGGVGVQLLEEMSQEGLIQIQDLPKSGKRGYKICILTEKGLRLLQELNKTAEVEKKTNAVNTH
jgi:predicted transcriptional regulator